MNTQTTSTARKKAFKWGKRVIITLVVMVGLSYGVLSLAQRSKEPIRMGLEDYLEQVTGHNAEVTNLEKVQLVPDVVFDINGVLLRDRSDAQKSLLKARSVSIALPLTNVMFGRGKYYEFNVQGLEIASGYILPKKIALDFAGVSHPDTALGEAHFILDGQYNAEPVLITAEMIVDSNGKRPLYGFRDEFPVTFKIGPLEGNGRYVRGWSGIDFTGAHIGAGNMAADFEVKNIKRNPVSAEIEGTLGDVAFIGQATEENGAVRIKLYPKEESGEHVKILEAFVASLETTLGLTDEAYQGLIEVQKFSKE